MAGKRIAKELAQLIQDPLEGVEIIQSDDLSHWDINLHGTGYYKKGIFKVTVDFPNDFPFKPPTVLFKTRIYHPNVDAKGNICMGMLKTDAWKPATQMKSVLRGLVIWLTNVNLLAEPNPDDPLDTDIAEVYMSDRKKFEAKVNEYLAKYAFAA